MNRECGWKCQGESSTKNKRKRESEKKSERYNYRNRDIKRQKPTTISSHLIRGPFPCGTACHHTLERHHHWRQWGKSCINSKFLPNSYEDYNGPLSFLFDTHRNFELSFFFNSCCNCYFFIHMRLHDRHQMWCLWSILMMMITMMMYVGFPAPNTRCWKYELEITFSSTSIVIEQNGMTPWLRMTSICSQMVLSQLM